MFRAVATLVLLAVIAAFPAGAQPVRSEAEIRQATLSNGARRYAVPVRVGATTLLAALDTGSTGLRILPGVLAPGDAVAIGEAETYGYASGSRYEGVVGDAAVTIGGARGAARSI